MWVFLDMTNVAFGSIAWKDGCMVTVKKYPEFDIRFVQTFLLSTGPQFKS